MVWASWLVRRQGSSRHCQLLPRVLGVLMRASGPRWSQSATGRKLLNDFFSSLNPTQWVAFGFAAALGTAYGVGQAVYYYNALIDPLVKAFQEAFADAAASTTTPVPAAA